MLFLFFKITVSCWQYKQCTLKIDYAVLME